MARKEVKSCTILFDQRAENDDGLQKALAEFSALGYAAYFKKIDTPGDAVRYAGQAIEEDVDTVIVVGGDGMLNLAVNGLLCDSSPVTCTVGLVPFGTGNDFASAGGIPDHFSQALDIITCARPVPIDVGQVNQRFFVNVAMGGFPAEAVADIPRTAKALLGRFAYLATGLVNIGNLAAKHIQIAAPGFEWEGPVYALGLANARQAGGGIIVAPKAVVDDGLLDLVIIPRSEAGLVSLISDYARMIRLDEPDRFIYRQVSWLNLTSRETISLNLDGETIKGKSFHFRIHARRLPFCLPENSPILNSLHKVIHGRGQPG